MKVFRDPMRYLLRNLTVTGMIFLLVLTSGGVKSVLYGKDRDIPTTVVTNPKESSPYDDYPEVYHPDYYQPEVFSQSGGLGLGLIHADGIGFNYYNNMMQVRSVYSHLRNVPLVTYSGNETPSQAPNSGGTANWGTGGYDTAPYGPGYAPAYEQTSNYRNGLYRGQAEYGDPGTLIYSVWAQGFGGEGTVKDHYNTPGYKTEQKSGLIGIDLFCSCDCRSGLFYGYQDAKIKDLKQNYFWTATGLNSVVNTDQYITETGEILTDASRNDYAYKADYKGTYSATLRSKNHLIGAYHQFGDEFIYNIGTLRLGYNNVRTTETMNESGTNTYDEAVSYCDDYDPEQTDYDPILNPDGNVWTVPTITTTTTDQSGTLDPQMKYHEYLGGISFERGANFRLAPFTFTPRGMLDYTYMYREKKTLEGSGVSYELKKKSYHSLRSDVGAHAALDLYPGDMQFRFLVRASWIHEFLNGIYGPTNITTPYYNGKIQGNSMGRDWGQFGGGIQWNIVPAFYIAVDYDYYKNKYLAQHYGGFGLGILW